MYTPNILIALIYVLRFVMRSVLPNNMRLRCGLVFMLAMYALILLIGTGTGTARFYYMAKQAPVAVAKILSRGHCRELEIYQQGKHRRAYKHVYQAEVSSLDELPESWHAPLTSGGIPCISYAFMTGERTAVYSRQVVDAPVLPAIANMQPIEVVYEPGYVENNWILGYIPLMLEDNKAHALFLLGVLVETVISGYYLGIRKNRRLLP